MNKIKLGCVLLLVASLAQAEDTKKWYAGASIGQAKVDSGINITSSTETLDEKDTAFKLYGGYQYNKYLAAEIYYADLGEVTYSNGSTTNLKAEVESYGVTAVGSYPIHKHVVPFVKAGFQHWDGKVTGNASSTTFNAKGNGNKPVYGAGVNLPITESISLRTEYEVIKLDEEDYKVLSAGLVYKF